MAKKKEYTFADAAKQVMKRFPRRETDPIEKRDYEQAMQELQQEQEMVRQQMGLTQPQEGMSQEFKGGGKMKYQTGGDLLPGYNTLDLSQYYQESPYLTPQQLSQMGQPWQRPNQQVLIGQSQGTNRVVAPPVNQSGINRNPLLTDTTKMGMRVGNRVFTRPGENMGARVGGVFASGTGNPNINVGASIPAQNLETNKINSFGQSQVNKAGEMAEKSWWDKNKQYAPYAISGLSNIASNLLLANMAKRNQPRVSAAMATPERINLEPQAEALRGQAGVAKNVASTNARNLGLNPMQAMASMSAAGTGIDRNLGDVLTNLYMQQEGANVGAANQFALYNQAAENRARAMSVGLDQQALENRLGYTGAALGSLPGVMKDIRMDKADQATRDMYSTYFKSMGRNYMNEGDIWDNPKYGYRYVVRNNQLVKQGKSK